MLQEGIFWTYKGNGFSTELLVNIDRANTSVQELKQLLWIDRKTRAVFLEMILFNSYVNLFSFVTMRVEFPISGGVFPHSETTHVRLYASGLNGIYMRVVEVLFVALLFANLGISIFLLYINGLKTVLKSVRIYLDIAILLNGLVLIALYLLRFFTTQDLVTEVKGSVINFLPFQKVVLYHSLFMYWLALITCLAVLKLIVLLRLNERIAKFGAILRHSFSDVIWTGLIFLFGIFAYGALCYLAFRDQYVFSSLIRAIEMLFAFALGQVDGLEDLFDNPTFGVQLFVFTFTLFSQIIMLNILIAVIMEAHETFREKSVLHPKDHELVGEVFGQVRTGVKKTLETYTKIQ